MNRRSDEIGENSNTRDKNTNGNNNRKCKNLVHALLFMVFLFWSLDGVFLLDGVVTTTI